MCSAPPLPACIVFRGYQQALESAGILLRDGYVKQGRHSREEARRCGLELLALVDRPTAVFAASDIQAIGVMEAVRDAGLRVPQDLSVVGYDDLDVADYIGLTTVRQSLFESGRRGAELLLQAMEGQLADPVSVEMPVELVVRQSSQRVNNALKNT